MTSGVQNATATTGDDRPRLARRLRQVARRARAVYGAAGLLWAVAAGLGWLVLAAWVDMLWELSPGVRVGVWGVATLLAVGVLAAAARRASVRSRPYAIALQLDRAGRTGGRVLSGLDLEAAPRTPRAPLTEAMAQRAVADAGRTAAGVAARAAVSSRPAGRGLVGLALLLLAVVAVGLVVPRLVATQWLRLVRPYDDIPPFAWTEFDVTPGDTQAVYGAATEIQVKTTGAPVDFLELVIDAAGGRREVLPMFPDSATEWRAVLDRIVEPARYHVRSHRARSRHYRIGLITVPRIEEVTVEVTPPEYSRLPVFRGPLPSEGIAGLRGTRVEIRAKSNRELSAGLLSLEGQGEASSVAMQPSGSQSREVHGEFTLAGSGKLEVRVTDSSGQPSTESVAATVMLLDDRGPLVVVREPPETSLATPDSVVPVVLAAEDDYGLSRLLLYRSLNHSRPRPLDFDLPTVPPRRMNGTSQLWLDTYGLAPGDEIRLFGRAEDNDPAGAKGAETPVTVIHVISREKFDQLVRLRQGLEAMSSKYDSARRLLERLAEAMNELERQAQEGKPGGEMSPELRRAMEEMIRKLGDGSKALRELSDQEAMCDLDAELAKQLEAMAKCIEQLQSEMQALLDAGRLDENLLRQLRKLIEELGVRRDEFRQQVLIPMEQFMAVMPLMADGQKFLMLVLRQMDLAERLKEFDGKDVSDDPAGKRRLWELANQQRQLRDELSELLDAIDGHADALPDAPELAGLREAAHRFAGEVRQSGALEAMDEAAARAEASDGNAFQKAQEAAEILRKFISLIQGEGSLSELGKKALAGLPSLGDCAGRSIGQLLAAMGFGGMGGAGQGSGFGMSALRAAGPNVGLFGPMPALAGREGAGAGNRWASGAGPRGPGDQGANPEDDTQPSEAGAAVSAAGDAAAVPLRYRPLVGKYFDRLNRELPAE